MSKTLPVTVAVRRPDGSIEHVQVGTAVPAGDGFRLTLGDLTIGGAAAAAPARRGAAPPPADGLVFPPYGRSKGQPIAGATVQDLEYYASGCRRTLDDPNKARWHDKERQLLAAIEAEMARQGHTPGAGGAGGGRGRGRDAAAPPRDEPPPFGDEDAPPPDEEPPW